MTRAVRATVVVVLLAVVSACSAIPTGGPVRQVRENEGFEQSTALYAPAPPSPGATPQQVVAGYLDAMLAFPPSTGVAERYLTEDAARRWNPAAGTQVYRDPSVAELRTGTTSARVRLSTQRVLRLGPSGRVAEGAGAASWDLALQRVDGEWRISEPPPGLLVSDKFYTDYYRAFQVYFFDPTGSRLVASAVHLPAGEQLATALVASLARGPSDPGAQQRTYLPGLGDLRPAVPVDRDGVAEVDLGTSAADLSPIDQGRLSAQLVWTLRQVSDVKGVRVGAGSTTLTPTGGAVQSMGSWSRYGPREQTEPYVVVDGRRREAAELDGRRLRDLPAAWDVDPDETADLVVGPERLATLSRDRERLLVRRTSGTDRVEVAVDRLVSAWWTTDDTLVVVDRPGAGPRVRVVEPQATRVLPLGGLAGLDVTSFAISPDGARYAVTTAGVDGRVRVGAVRRSGDDALVGLGPSRALPWQVGRPSSVGFVDGVRLAFFGDTELGRQVFEGLVDGTSLEGGAAGGAPILPDVAPRTLVVEGERRWAVDRRDRLWYLGPDSTWTRLGITRVASLSPGA